MGDRCYVEITATRAHAALFDYQPDDKSDGAGPGVDLFCSEVNDADYDWLTERAKAGAVFYGRHDSGGSYGEYAFAAWDGKVLYCPTHKDWSGLCVLMDERTGEVIQESVDRARAYMEAYRNAFAFICAEEAARVAACEYAYGEAAQ